jgi:hypothetical protein
MTTQTVEKDVAFDFMLHTQMYRFFRDCDSAGLRFLETERSRCGTHIKSRCQERWIPIVALPGTTEKVEWPHIEVWCEDDKQYGKMRPPKVLESFLRRKDLTHAERRAEASLIQWAYDDYMIELSRSGEKMAMDLMAQARPQASDDH